MMKMKMKFPQFNPKTQKGKSKVDCSLEEKNGDLTPRDVGKITKILLV